MKAAAASAPRPHRRSAFRESCRRRPRRCRRRARPLPLVRGVRLQADRPRSGYPPPRYALRRGLAAAAPIHAGAKAESRTPCTFAPPPISPRRGVSRTERVPRRARAIHRREPGRRRTRIPRRGATQRGAATRTRGSSAWYNLELGIGNQECVHEFQILESTFQIAMRPIAQAIPGAVTELLKAAPLSDGKVSFAWRAAVGPA